MANKRFQISLPEVAERELKEMAERTHRKLPDLIRTILETGMILQEQREEGFDRVVLKDKSGKNQKELILNGW